MSSYNRVIMVGNLTRDPETKQLPSGMTVSKLGLAVSRPMKSRDGQEGSQEVCFVDIDVWGVQAENCQKYLEKGSSILVEGRLKLDTWQDQEGNKKSKHSIVAERVTFLRTNKSEAESGFSKESKETSKFSNKGEINLKNEDAFKDDLPF